MSGYVFTDTETTGLDETKDRITQIAAIRTDENFKIRGVFKMHCYLPDDVELSEYAEKITGISRESLQNEPPEKFVMQAYMTFCYPVDVKDPLKFAGYNTAYDLKMLMYAMNRHKQWSLFQKCIQKTSYCVMKHSREVLLDVPKFIDPVDQKTKQYTLGNVAQHLGIRIKPHDALEDIAATLKIAKHIRRIKS